MGTPTPPTTEEWKSYKFAPLELSEVDAIMTLQYRLSFKWMDSRVRYRNLKSYEYLNTLGSIDAAKIWHPKVVFYNTRDMEKTKVKTLQGDSSGCSLGAVDIHTKVEF